MSQKNNKLEVATFAGGCFWCTEAVFNRLKGVIKVESGYSGGHVKNPTYEEVSTGQTEHAESVQITFDPSVLPFTKLLDVFWRLHDPTTLNQQGVDIGTQYRSAIFYHDDKQKKEAIKSKEALDKSGIYSKPAVTEIVPYKNFYPAEAYHQCFYENNPQSTYCKIIIDPKITKLYKEFKEDLKK